MVVTFSGSHGDRHLGVARREHGGLVGRGHGHGRPPNEGAILLATMVQARRPIMTKVHGITTSGTEGTTEQGT